MYVYRHIETDQHGQWLYTVGFYSPDGEWNPEGDYDSEESASKRVHYLNGGKDDIQ